MIGEVDIYGVFVHPLLPILVVALAASAGLRSLLRRIGFYRMVWHRPLFDLALLVILVGALVAIIPRWGLS